LTCQKVQDVCVKIPYVFANCQEKYEIYITSMTFYNLQYLCQIKLFVINQSQWCWWPKQIFCSKTWWLTRKNSWVTRVSRGSILFVLSYIISKVKWLQTHIMSKKEIFIHTKMTDDVHLESHVYRFNGMITRWRQKYVS